MLQCAPPLHAWVRKGDQAVRLKFIRALGDPGGVSLPSDTERLTIREMVKEMATGVVQTLLDFAKGRQMQGKDKKDKNGKVTKGRLYGFYPYGKPAAEQSKVFTAVSTAWLASTLAEMYPFVKADKDKWDGLKTKVAHPMTMLWPWPTVNRHLSFQRSFHANRDQLFKEYELGGG